MKKKKDLKKLALMGITGGVMCASQVSAAVDLNSSAGTVLASGCGGKHGCGHNTAYQPHGCAGSPQPQVYYYNNQGMPANGNPTGAGAPPASGCGGSKPVNAGQPNQPYYISSNQGLPSSGCANRAPAPSYYSTNQGTPSSGCGGNRPPNNNPGQPQPYYFTDNSGSSNNGGRNNNGNGSAGQDQRAYTKWDNGNLADTGKNNSGSYGSMNAQGLLTESQLLSQLNDQGKALYQGLDAEGKALALKLAAQMDDKNQAVKIAAQKMAEKRAKVNSGR